MSPNVQTVVARLQVREGGIVTQNDGPNGVAQTTWFGQTLEWLQAYKLPIPDSPSAAASNWASFMTQENLDVVCDFDLELGDVVTDACVNDGAPVGIEFLQKALGVTADGAMEIGGETLTALAKSDARAIRANVLAENVEYHMALTPKDDAFMAGWGTRLGAQIRRLA